MKALFERWTGVFILLMTIGTVFAQAVTEEYDPLKNFISAKYEAGPALVYDCLDKHWVCTGPNEHSVCSERRLENIQEGRIELNCMPDQIFPTIKECFEYIPRLIARGNVPRGCLHPAHRRRFIGFR